MFSWLERRNNTECPCCRENLVSDDEVWAAVQKMRKERRRQLRKENGPVHRFLKWATSNRSACQPNIEDRSRTTTVGSGSDDENINQEDRMEVDTNTEGLNE